jgi:hypothetical protein
MDNIVQLSSFTHAMKARDLLRDNGIRSRVQRVSGKKGRGVCSYSLNIENRFEEAIDILNKNNIKVIGRASGGKF